MRLCPPVWLIDPQILVGTKMNFKNIKNCFVRVKRCDWVPPVLEKCPMRSNAGTHLKEVRQEAGTSSGGWCTPQTRRVRNSDFVSPMRLRSGMRVKEQAREMGAVAAPLRTPENRTVSRLRAEAGKIASGWCTPPVGLLRKRAFISPLQLRNGKHLVSQERKALVPDRDEREKHGKNTGYEMAGDVRPTVAVPAQVGVARSAVRRWSGRSQGRSGLVGCHIVWQHNLNHDTKVTAEIRQEICRRGVGLVLMQEPYVFEKVPAGLGLSARLAYKKGGEAPKAAVLSAEEQICLTAMRHLSTEHCVCVQVTTPALSYYAISCYFQFADPIEEHLTHLDYVMKELRGERLIIGVDANAKSQIWGGNISDEKGLLVEDFIMQHDLRLLNDAAQPATYSHQGNESYIDLTLASRNMLPYIQCWRVIEGVTTSDHRVLEIRIGTDVRSNTGGTEAPVVARQGRFLCKKVDRLRFDRCLKVSLDAVLSGAPLETVEDVEGMARSMTDAIINACEASMPRKKWRYRCAPWWNAQLARMKRTVVRLVRTCGKMKRTLSRMVNPEAEVVSKYERRRNECRSEKMKYRRRVRSAKIESFRKFVTKVGNENPWGVVYKMQADKLNLEEVHGNLRKDVGFTKTAEETAQYFLNTLIPDAPRMAGLGSCPETGDGEWPQPMEDEQMFSPEEVAGVLKTLVNGKAPGPDLIEVEALKMACPLVGGELVRLFNACLRIGVFPEVWKRGSLRALYKGGNKDRLNPRSYRPLCLLSVLGKLLEKLILRSMNKTVLADGKLSDRQYGFRTGRSTEDALVEFRNIVASCEERYVLGIFFDITGAFDNVLWPMVIKGLRERACPGNVLRLLSSYFSDRTVSLSWGGSRLVSKKTSRGCPQGSVLGPSCWNIVFDDLLRKLEQRLGNRFVVYADDLTVLIAGDSRAEIERRGQEKVDFISAWCTEAGLQLSEAKTAMMYVKYNPRMNVKNSDLVRVRVDKTSMRSRNARRNKTKASVNSKCTDRPPVIRLNGKGVKYNKTVKLLGLYISEKMDVRVHCAKTAEALKGLFGRLRRLADRNWGLNCRTLRTIYQGVFVAKATYAARAWYDLAARNQKNVQILVSAQRSVLIGVTRAYRTVSADALPVLAGVLPIEIALKEAVARSELRNGEVAVIGDLEVANVEGETGVKGRIRREALRLWQVGWERAEHGKVTREYFPDVAKRCASSWVSSDHYVAQFLTGHGDFASWLLSRGVVTGDGLCSCGLEETMQHILTDCPNYESQRAVLMSELTGEQRRWPEVAGQLVRREAYQAFVNFAKEVLTLKEARDRLSRGNE